MTATFLERLAELRGDLKVSEFARRVGVPATTLRQYDSGSLPSIEIAGRIADVYDVTIDWLSGRSDERRSRVPYAPRPEELPVLLPRYSVSASAGPGTLVPTEQVAEHMSVGRNWLRRNLPGWASLNAQVGVVDGSGDSMEPTIRDGDLLMVVHDPPWRIVEAGGIFVVTVDERLLLKRLHVTDQGALQIMSDNPRYETWSVRMDDIPHRVIVHAQVFFVGGKPRG